MGQFKLNLKGRKFLLFLLLAVRCVQILSFPSVYRTALRRMKRVLLTMRKKIYELINKNLFLSQSQWKENSGKCGLCGDPWNGPRDHESGGKYFTNHISSSYSKGSLINVTVFTNLNPSGWMEFRIHSYKSENSPSSEDIYLLPIGVTKMKRYRVRRSGYHVIPVKLPNDLECKRCILQWKFRTGKNLLSNNNT